MRPRQLLALAWLAISALVTAAVLQAQPPREWWQDAVIYEIYPRSFGDTNGDGIGDLNGITEHLDYLSGLGVDAIWITPFYPSPQVDFGYDISNYRGIDPQYGTMQDFDRLVREAKKRNIRVITDLVLNHTSDQHPWFLESKSSRTNPKADWYIWRDGKANGQLPNNWESLFGHSAWQYIASRNQYYYHKFYKEQPDLNWRNPDVRNAMWDVVRFWMDRGVSGFRLDAITTLFEDPEFRDEPYLPGYNAYGDRNISEQYTDNLPEVHDILRKLREITDKYPGSVLIGETYVNSTQDLLTMYGIGKPELQLPMDTRLGIGNHLSASSFRRQLIDAETKLKGNFPLFVFDNHDNPRSWSTYGDGKHNLAIAKLIATVLLTPRCSALVYYGQEIGMEERTPQRKEDVRDPIGKIGWPKEKGRDGERTPMQWNDNRDAGFSSATQTWLPVEPDYKTRNVAIEEQQPDSLLNYYKALIRLRKENRALRDGDFVLLDPDNQNVLSFLRKAQDGNAVLISLNCTGTEQTVSFRLGADGLPATAHMKTVLASFSPLGSVDVKHLALPPFGAYVGEIEP